MSPPMVNIIKYNRHAIERVVIIILVNSQYSIFDTRYRFGLAKQGFRAYVYMIWIVLFICISYSNTATAFISWFNLNQRDYLGLIRLISKLRVCDKCSFKTLFKSHLQSHKRSHSKPDRPTFYMCMSTCKRKNGKVYYHRVKAKVREHMKTCCYYKLTLSSVPKSIFMADSVCFLASRSWSGCQRWGANGTTTYPRLSPRI